MKQVKVYFEPEAIRKIDNEWYKRGYSSRSAFIRTMVGLVGLGLEERRRRGET